MQKPVLELISLDALPSEKTATVSQLEVIEALVLAIQRPITDQEAEALVSVFGEDECFGIAWSVLHLIETAPNWPIKKCLTKSENIWVSMLIERSKNAGLL